MKPRKKHPWYDFGKLLSYNGTFNFVAGGRGIGKTYGAKKRTIRAALRSGEQFIYLRRYKSELITSKQTFFADIGDEFPDWDFRVIGNEAHAAPVATADDDKRPWQTIGYFISLSNAQSQKGASFHNVTSIIFDEFIIEKGHLRYLPDETTVMLNFYSTVDRYQDKTKVLFLANSVSIMNPYFIQYNIRPDEEKEFTTKHDGYVVAHFPDSSQFQSSVYQTAFGKFIQGTQYADYAVGNAFADNNAAMLSIKGAHAVYMYSLELKTMTVSVWLDPRKNEYYAQAKQPKQPVIFTLDATRMADDKTLLLPTDKPLQSLRSAFRHARLSFDEPSTRNAFTEVFKR